MVTADSARQGRSTTALYEEPPRFHAYVVEVVPLHPRSDLAPDLHPFERAVLHVSAMLKQVQGLLQEDLNDLRLPLLTCLQQAQSESERGDAEQAMALFERLLQSTPIYLQPLLDCFRQAPTLREKRPWQSLEEYEPQSHGDLRDRIAMRDGRCLESGKRFSSGA